LLPRLAAIGQPWENAALNLEEEPLDQGLGSVGAASARVSVRRYALALVCVAVAGLVGFLFSWFFGQRALATPFLVALTLSGVWFGRRPALAAVVPAFFAYNFFAVAPHFSLKFGPGDLLALFSFLATALLVGGLAGELSDRARGTAEQLRRVTALFAASRDLSAATTVAEVARSLVTHLEGVGLQAAVWSRPDQGRTPLAATLEAEAAGALAAPPEAAPLVNGRAAELRPLMTARGKVGLVAIWGAGRKEPEGHWLATLLHLGAIALDRAWLAGEISEARMVAEREGLRTALLSSLSHDLRTPIATIVASASSLAEYGAVFDARTRLEFVETIQEQGERLNRYVANLLDMTRLESGALAIKRVMVDPAEAMGSALEHMRRRLQDRRIVRAFTAPDAMIAVDPVLIEQALVNVLENAASLSPPDSAIRAGVSIEDGEVLLTITDEGPGIRPEELPYVFDKFFRGDGDRGGRAGGVGLGLSVTRGVVEAFDGRISAESPVANGRGARFTIRLPSHRAMEAVE
jgi:two-component system sensor histidine kinase KdpD